MLDRIMEIIEIGLASVLTVAGAVAFASVFFGHTHQLLMAAMCWSLLIVYIRQGIKDRKEDNNNR